MTSLRCAVVALALASSAFMPQSPRGSGSFAVSPMDFGAVCDGKTDDHRAIQAAVDAAKKVSGVVLWPSARCATTQTVVVGGGDGPGGGGASFVSIRGSNPATSWLVWTGTRDGTALALSANKYFTIEGLGVANLGDKGTTVGIALTGPAASNGTMTLAGIFENVSVGGFHLGIQAGSLTADAATSEIRYESLTLSNNDYGWANVNFNTLDHQFHMLLMDGNTIAGVWLKTGNLWVDGGSASFNGTDFLLETNPHAVTIQNYRSEGVKTQFLRANSGAMTTAMRNVHVTGTFEPDSVVVDLQGGNLIELDGNMLGGFVRLSAPVRSFRMHGNAVKDTGTPLPFLWSRANGSPYGTDVYAEGNAAMSDIGVITRKFPDARGMFVTAPGEMGTVFQPLTMTLRSFPMPGLQMSGVHMLGYASQADGRNLRDQVTFAGSGTAAYTFTRTVTVSTTPTAQVLLVPAGSFNILDVGKKIVVPGVGYQGRDAIGYVSALVDPTHIAVGVGDGAGAAGSGLIRSSGTGLRALVGEDEPDANYRIVGLVGDADERFWVDSSTYSASGVHVRSSQPNSTATVTFLIVR